MLAQGLSAAFDGVGGEVNIIRQLRDCPGEQSQDIVIFLVALRGPIGGGFNFLQLADIDTGDLKIGRASCRERVSINV